MGTYANPRRTKRDRLILELATRTLPLVDGTLELDRHSAVISEGGDNGAYVQVWGWVSFEGTELDKEAEIQAISGSP